jgi:hypothetical protein
MSTPTLLTILGIIALLPLSAYSDDSETNAEQILKQKNVGSGESTNFNCGENLIDSAVSAICLAEPPPPPPPETATLSVCKDVAFGGEPVEFAFTVTGNGPSPDQFILGDEECVDVTIGAGEYAVTETSFSPCTFITGDCVQDPPGAPTAQRATGEIQAGETQECLFTNETD